MLQIQRSGVNKKHVGYLPNSLPNLPLSLKGQCHKIWAPYEQAKLVPRTFSFSQRYSQKTCVSIVNDYAVGWSVELFFDRTEQVK